MHPDKVRVAVLSALFFFPCIASAQQPLEEFMTSSDTAAIDLHAAQAALDTARSQSDEARSRLLPSFIGQGTYQRNEIQSQIPLGTDAMGAPIIRVIIPYDQLSATLTLSVPILDISAWSSFYASEHLADAADERLAGTSDDVHAAVVQIWYQLVGTRAVRDAAQRNLDVATASRDTVQVRFEAQVAPQLELSRAEAEVQRATQALSEADLLVVLTQRKLENLTGLHPSQTAVTLEDDLHAEASLEEFTRRADEAPQVRAAAETVRAAELAVDAAWQSLLPTLAGTARETFTNAAGFGGNTYYALGITATWSLDFLRPAQIGTRGGMLATARAQAELADQQASTRIFEQWERVRTLRVAAAAASAACDALVRASEDAHLRFDAGAATQLDVIQADRDLFQSEVLYIQALANLGVARHTLRIRAQLE